MSPSAPPTVPQPTSPKKRIVVLGTGCGSMSALFGLTSAPGWQEQYEIDVYQLGFRCGGKGAAGRNRAVGDRIEEHGLHMWFGFYQNAFAMIREVYDELHRIRPDYRFATWREAFTPRSDLYLEEYVEGRWQRWHTTFPANDEVPGDGHPYQSLSTLVMEAIEWGIELLLGADVLSWLERHVGPFQPTAESSSLLLGLESRLGRVLRRLEERLDSAVFGAPTHPSAAFSEPLRSHLTSAHRLAEEAASSEDGACRLLEILRPIARWMERGLSTIVEGHTELRRAFILLDLGITLLEGLVVDGCIAAKSLDPIDRFDWMRWLEKNGAHRLCLESPWVRGLYDGPFAYLRGDTSQPSLSAAVAVRGQLRGFVGYKGAPMWMMNAGMGDTIFAPLYLVLRERGVRFHFFHKARELAFDDARTTLTSITLGIQATTKGGAPYQPLFPLEGIECWPSTPDYAQLVQGEELERRHVDLESSWTDWKDVGEKTLKVGEDFDLVIGGMSLAAWPHAAPALFEGTSETAARWRALHDGLPTVATQSAQLWIDATSAELGFSEPPGIIGGYAQPFDSWADLSPLLREERWPEGQAAPRALIYLCGPMHDPPATPPFTAHAFPAQQRERVVDAAANWLSSHGGYPWPSKAPWNEPASLDPALLHVASDQVPGTGWDRLRAQYLRANVEPTERYVLSPPGTAQLRMRADASGVTNLFIAGDWLSTGLQSGCVEAAVMGGLQASQAICGSPATIVGDDDAW